MQLCEQPHFSWNSMRSKEKAFKCYQIGSSLSVFLKQAWLPLIFASLYCFCRAISRLLKIYPHQSSKLWKAFITKYFFKNDKYVVDWINIFFSFLFQKVRWILAHWVGIFLSLKVNQFHTYLRLIPHSDFKESTCLLLLDRASEFLVTLVGLDIRMTLKIREGIKLRFKLSCSLDKMISCGPFGDFPFQGRENLVTLKTYTINGTCRSGRKSWGWTLCVFKLNPLSLRSCCMGQRKMNA